MLVSNVAASVLPRVFGVTHVRSMNKDLCFCLTQPGDADASENCAIRPFFDTIVSKVSELTHSFLRAHLLAHLFLSGGSHDGF